MRYKNRNNQFVSIEKCTYMYIYGKKPTTGKMDMISLYTCIMWPLLNDHDKGTRPPALISYKWNFHIRFQHQQKNTIKMKNKMSQEAGSEGRSYKNQYNVLHVLWYEFTGYSS